MNLFLRNICRIALLPTLTLAALAQQPTAPIAFEVTSVKPADPGCGFSGYGFAPDGFHLRCMSLLQLTKFAYGVNMLVDGNVQGLPAWASTDRFDLDAKLQDVDRARFADLKGPGKSAVLRSALSERFGLKAHEEQRELPVYALTQGKPPLKLKASDATTPAETHPTLLRRRNRIEGYHCLLESLASFLSPLRGRPVVNQTGLTGEYDFTLEFTPENAKPNPDGDTAPSIFTAVQEQLGLQLIAGKAPLRVVIVDHVDKPEPN